MIYRAYRFSSQAVADAALASTQPIALDVIGVAYADPVAEGDPPDPLPGWHVNAAWHVAPPALASMEIDPVAAPRWWSGVPRVFPAAPAVVPLAVSARQARLALLQAGLLPAVDAAVSTMGAAARVTWEYAVEIRRDDALLASMAASLGLTESQVDALFVAAAAL